MLSFAIAIAVSSSIMRAVSTLTESRFKETYFTRKRKMPFDSLLKYLLSMHKTSSQSALNNFLENRGITMSQQALSKARSKFNHKPFQKLFDGIRDAFYQKEYYAVVHIFFSIKIYIYIYLKIYYLKRSKKWLHSPNGKCNHLKILIQRNGNQGTKQQHCKETENLSGCIVSFVECFAITALHK